MRRRLAWLANTRPDMQFEISQLAQVRNDAAAHLKNLNTIMRYAHDKVAHLLFPKLDLATIRIVGYSDSAFANYHDLSSRLGRIVLLMDDTASAIHFVIQKLQIAQGNELSIIRESNCLRGLVR